MFGFGHWELLIVLVIAMIIFGAGKLPQIGSGLGNAIGNFKKGLSDSDKVESEIHQKIETD
jgi:sec-independent protein translocase protein TatA